MPYQRPSRHAWKPPILRLTDTVIGIAVGVAVVWIDVRVILPQLSRG